MSNTGSVPLVLIVKLPPLDEIPFPNVVKPLTFIDPVTCKSFVVLKKDPVATKIPPTEDTPVSSLPSPINLEAEILPLAVIWFAENTDPKESTESFVFSLLSVSLKKSDVPVPVRFSTSPI